VELSLEDLRTRFRKHHVAATLQCTGNRRRELAASKPIKGLDWEGGAISTAVWGGVRLSDVLAAAGLERGDASPVKHIQARRGMGSGWAGVVVVMVCVCVVGGGWGGGSLVWKTISPIGGMHGASALAALAAGPN
jgi:hypothetical protein